MEADKQMIPFPSSRADPGLIRLLPLYHFLQNPCREVVHKILVNGFQTSLFIQENLSSQCASKPKAKGLICGRRSGKVDFKPEEPDIFQQKAAYFALWTMWQWKNSHTPEFSLFFKSRNS
ncbi:hypothetical protein C7M84_000400 [Penaeus vannamei]|uniref:Uncharacterized protein n=1 Tax=Penaeus vannamei TaxID=6689 RepID=A0A423TWN4_PENVA|nr:hypothetical protein C7M84_000400 [Penaeus vannamei]